MRWTLLMLLATTWACAGAQPEPGVVQRTRVSAGQERETVDLTVSRAILEREVAASRARTFAALISVVSELGLPVESQDARAGTATFLLQTGRMRIDGRPAAHYIDCGMGPGGPRANSYRISLRVVGQVDELADVRARLSTVIAATARDPGTSSAELNCTSTGRLEQLIAERVRAHVEG